MVELTIKELLKRGQSSFNEQGIPEIEARFILEWLVKMDFTQLINHYNDTISSDISEEYFRLITKRMTRYPLQYLLNNQNFYGFDYYVDERVLIPRPETELLVERIIKDIKDINDLHQLGKHTFSILDLCTGSGCIILSIAKSIELYLVDKVEMENNFQEINYIGTDISVDALAVAKINEENLFTSSKIQWRQGDLFGAISSKNSDFQCKKFDVIVSNPPYISPKDILTLEPEVNCFEPMNALDGGVDGLEFYAKIAKEATEWLNHGGKLYLEIGHGQMKDVKEMLLKNEFSNIEGMYDLYGCERIVQGVFLKES